jgi:hypothetical protein
MRFLGILLAISMWSGHALAQSSRSSSSGSDAPVPCLADLRWTNTNSSLTYFRQSQTPVSLSLLSHVSKGTGCSHAELRVTATFLSDTQEFICSGVIAQAMTTESEVQNFNIEIRPFTQNEFLRWRNQPGARGIQQGKRLNCIGLDGTSEVTDVDRAKATWIYLTVAVLPDAGGLGVLEGLIHVNQ